MEEHIQKKKWCFRVVICTTVGGVVSLVSMIVYWRNMRIELMAPREQDVCYPCDRFISTDPKEDYLNGLRQEFDERRNLTTCCGSVSSVLSRLAEKGVSDRYNGDANPELAKLNLTEYGCSVKTDVQITAKLVGLDLHKTPVQVGKSLKLFWNASAPSYVKSGLKHLDDDGTLYVETPGLYFIFSQIKVRLESVNDADSTTEETFRHYVHLISRKEGKGTTLLEDARSPCEMVTDASEVTSVIGAPFKLETGDRLYVATSHPQRILPDRKNNYFSVYLM